MYTQYSKQKTNKKLSLVIYRDKKRMTGGGADISRERREKRRGGETIWSRRERIDKWI